MASSIEVLTIGHSTLSYEQFLSLLRKSAVTAVADVRAAPYSRFVPQFNRDTLKEKLWQDGVSYVFMGEELGGRPSMGDLFSRGIADYERMANTVEFVNGVNRIIVGAQKYRIAMMCSERDPLDCHRCLLIGRALHERDVSVKHIMSDGTTTAHDAIEKRLIQMFGKDGSDFFSSQASRRAEAYRERAAKVAYAKPEAKRPEIVEVERN